MSPAFVGLNLQIQRKLYQQRFTNHHSSIIHFQMFSAIVFFNILPALLQYSNMALMCSL